MLELTHKDFKVTVISIFKDLKENIIIMSGWMGNLNKAMETIKKCQVEILEQKSNMSEIKI